MALKCMQLLIHYHWNCSDRDNAKVTYATDDDAAEWDYFSPHFFNFRFA